MYRLICTICTMALVAGSASAQTAPSTAKRRTAAPPKALVEFEMMTWVEVKNALAAGRTIAAVCGIRADGGLKKRSGSAGTSFPSSAACAR